METLEDIIENFYVGYSHKDIILVILDLDGVCKFLSFKAADDGSRLPPKEFFLGKKYQEFIQQPKLEAIRQEVIKNEIIVNYVLVPVNPFLKLRRLTLHASHSPIFNKHGKLVGTQIFYTRFVSISLENLIYGQSIKYDKSKIEALNLTDRQHGILFMLTKGFTQDQVAEYFQITRGTVLRIVVGSIANKLLSPTDLNRNVFSVIKAAKLLGIHYYVPFEVFKDGVVCLNPDVNIE